MYNCCKSVTKERKYGYKIKIIFFENDIEKIFQICYIELTNVTKINFIRFKSNT